MKNANSTSTKCTRAIRHESHETWDAYEYVRFKAPEAIEGWGAKKHVGYEEQVGRENVRHETREVQKSVKHVKHEIT